jgi:predicted HTH domain antitoxin
MTSNYEALTEDYEADIEFLISLFHSLFSYYNVEENIYSLGKFSNYVANKLQTFTAAVSRRKVK